MLMRATPRRGEAASAIVAAIAVMVLASFVIVAIMVASRASSDSSRQQLDSAASEQLARDAGAMLAASYSSLSSGEYDGFLPSATVLKAYSARLDGGGIAKRASASDVDVTRIPDDRRWAVMQRLDEQRRGWWQVYSVRLPTWGETKGGKVVVYVRTWTESITSGTETQPMIYRIEFRPSWFADYQMLFDGPAFGSSGAKIEGRIHSNGYNDSFFDQYASFPDKITIPNDASCAPGARITTARGTISGPPICKKPSVSQENTGQTINMLRARDMADRLRWICDRNAAERTGISLKCLDSTAEVDIVLGKDTLTYDGTSLNARVEGDRPGQNQGAILVTHGNVNVSGTLGPDSRAMVVASSKSDERTYGTNGAPSAWILRRGDVGAAAGEQGSSFGLVVEGDIIFDERTACPVTARGAFVTMTGLMSIHPTWRVPVQVDGGERCRDEARIQGSIAGHFSPIMSQTLNNAGYDKRTYDVLKSLYHNPPPMYPTAADWQAINFAPADLDCFTKSGGSYTLSSTCE